MLFLLIAIIAYFYYPIKYAVHTEEINTNNEHIIVTAVKSTGLSWETVPDAHSTPQNVILSGNYPQGYTVNIDMDGNNKFVCYGKVTEKKPGGEIVFDVTSWDILYPISYAPAVFPKLHPDAYLCRLDYNPK